MVAHNWSATVRAAPDTATDGHHYLRLAEPARRRRLGNLVLFKVLAKSVSARGYVHADFDVDKTKPTLRLRRRLRLCP